MFSQFLESFWKLPTPCLELQNAEHAVHWDVLAAEEQDSALSQVSAAFMSWGVAFVSLNVG